MDLPRWGMKAGGMGCDWSHQALYDYLVPKRGAAFDNRPCSYCERYCGLFPVQFLDTFSPSDGRGLVLRTIDTQCLRKHYVLKKEAGTFTIGVEYPERALNPGEHFTTAPAILTATVDCGYREKQAVDEKQCRQDSRGPAKEGTGTAGAEYRRRCAATKGRAHIRTLAVLDEYQGNDGQCQAHLYNDQDCKHYLTCSN